MSAVARAAKSICIFPREAEGTDLDSNAHAKICLQSLDCRLNARIPLCTTKVLRPSADVEIRGWDFGPAMCPEARIVSRYGTRLGLEDWLHLGALGRHWCRA